MTTPLQPGFYWVVDTLAADGQPFVAQWDDQWHIPGSDIPEAYEALTPISERLQPPTSSLSNAGMD